MAQLIVQAAAAYVGSYFGPAGAQAGWMIAPVIGRPSLVASPSSGERIIIENRESNSVEAVEEEA